MNKIAVIVPVYNVADYLCRCVDSILGQSLTNLSLILVDDGSTDACPGICDDYASRDARVTVFHQRNGGLSAARNAGVDYAICQGLVSHIAFVDSDDWVHPEYLSSLYGALNDCKIAACWCRTIRDDERAGEAVSPTFQVMSPEEYWSTNRIAATVAWGKLYDVELFRELRYPVGRIHEDEYVTYKLLFSQRKVSVSFAPLYYYYQRSNSIIGSKWSDKNFQAFPALDDQLSYFEKNNLWRAFNSTALSYLNHIASGIEQVVKDDLTREKYYKVLKRALVNVYTRTRVSLSLNMLRDYRICKFLFPFRAHLCFPFLRAADLLRRRGLVWMVRRMFDKI